METIILSHPHDFKKEQLPPCVLALGYFDGIHIGHQKVITTAKQTADELGVMSAVMSFHPHPSVVLGKNNVHWTYLTPLEEKKKVLKQLGIDRFYLVTFDHAFASLPPQDFLDQYVKELHAVHVVTGFDFTYGKLGAGNTDTLQFSSDSCFGLTVIGKVERDGIKVSSTLIRRTLQEGSVAKLKEYFGRLYTVEGRVIPGDQRGRTIGFPTANLDTGSYTLPGVGVYAVLAEYEGKKYSAMANIGFKPTFQKTAEKPNLEVHLFDFSKSIYGETLKIHWIQRIRSEVKFASVQELVRQLEEDKERASAIINQLQ
ncbi:riboflavin biosynthesis protein RibF [Fictibacillus aquaticus]|uniref:Riboflavin biosynthesis protein n=1 Tax=Fictibacillus aquaticus TaxID=2021314 RepID=A0A235FCS0_9BACL|nr:riboflavin biosynthesis protein RibF [Fictibacillus aquaticus]OYD58814.1 riboflavin biosynthesis protein RibF [Fictibacillus aquaticus]